MSEFAAVIYVVLLVGFLSFFMFFHCLRGITTFGNIYVCINSPFCFISYCQTPHIQRERERERERDREREILLNIDR